MDPRVAPPPKTEIDELLHKMLGSGEVIVPERDLEKLKQILAYRRDREREQVEELRRLQNEAMQLHQNVANQQSIAQRMAQMQNNHMADSLKYAMQSPRIARSRPDEPAPLDAVGEAARTAQQFGYDNMNQIARMKYEPVMELLDIKLRFTGVRAGSNIKQWIIAKMGKNGTPIRQEWTAPSQDPGCSLRTWDAMMGELLDEVARRDGITVTNDNTADPASAGQQVPSGAGNP